MIANGDIVTEEDAADGAAPLRRGWPDDRPRLLRPAVVHRPGGALPAHRPAPAGTALGAAERRGDNALPMRSSSHFGSHAGVRLARKHVSWYSRGLPGSAEFRAAMNRLPDADPVLAADRQLLRSADRPWRHRVPRRGATRCWRRRHDQSRSPAPRWRCANAAGRPTSAQIMSALPVPVVLLDADNRFRFVNHAAEQFLGISAVGPVAASAARPGSGGQPAVPAGRAGPPAATPRSPTTTCRWTARG